MKLVCDSRADLDLILQVVDRVVEMFDLSHGDRRMLFMDLNVCHANGCELNLEMMLTAPKLDLAHDISGIQRHLNRETGQLENCFSPRYAATWNPRVARSDPEA